MTMRYFNMSRTLAALALLQGTALLSTPQKAAAQAPLITGIVTGYGYKNNLPATLTNTLIQIQGNNLPSSSVGLTIKLNKNVIVNGQQQLQFVRNLTPTAFGRNSITTNIGSAAAAEYRITLDVYRAGSTFAGLLVIPSTTKLESYYANPPFPNHKVHLFGNLLPQMNTVVVLTPPAEIAGFMGTPVVIPTQLDRYNAEFFLPANIWDGMWKVHIAGYDIATGMLVTTNMLPLEVKVSEAPQYAVRFHSFQCITETHDFSASDEIYASLISYEPAGWIYETYNFGVAGTTVHEDVDAGETKYDDVDFNTVGSTEGIYHRIADPSKAYYIVGLSECDQFTNYIGGSYWDPFIPNVQIENWAKQRAGEAMGWWYDYYTHHLSTVQSYTPMQIATWVKDKLFNVINVSDDAIGSKIVTFTKNEVNQARMQNGLPVNKVIDFVGDGGHYKVTIQLLKIVQ